MSLKKFLNGLAEKESSDAWKKGEEIWKEKNPFATKNRSWWPTALLLRSRRVKAPVISTKVAIRISTIDPVSRSMDAFYCMKSKKIEKKSILDLKLQLHGSIVSAWHGKMSFSAVVTDCGKSLEVELKFQYFVLWRQEKWSWVIESRTKSRRCRSMVSSVLPMAPPAVWARAATSAKLATATSTNKSFPVKRIF